MSFIDSLRDVATQMFDSVDNSLNPGRTKVNAYKKYTQDKLPSDREQLRSFYDNVDRSVVDIDDNSNVDFTKKFTLDYGNGKKRDVYVSYIEDRGDPYGRNGGGTKIARIYDGAYSDRPISGRDAIAKYLRSNYNMDQNDEDLRIEDFGIVNGTRSVDYGTNPDGTPYDGRGTVRGRGAGYGLNSDLYYGGRMQLDPWGLFPTGYL